MLKKGRAPKELAHSLCVEQSKVCSQQELKNEPINNVGGGGKGVSNNKKPYQETSLKSPSLTKSKQSMKNEMKDRNSKNTKYPKQMDDQNSNGKKQNGGEGDVVSKQKKKKKKKNKKKKGPPPLDNDKRNMGSVPGN